MPETTSVRSPPTSPRKSNTQSKSEVNRFYDTFQSKVEEKRFYYIFSYTQREMNFIISSVQIRGNQILYIQSELELNRFYCNFSENKS